MVNLRRLYLQSSALKVAAVKFTNGESWGQIEDEERQKENELGASV
jgi:hypothetical protein